MTDKPIMIDGVDVNGCSYAILPKSQCPQKAMLYAKEVSCIACKENNTKLNFCKNNHNCNYKQLQRKTAECEELKKALAIKTGKDYINEIQDIQMKYECHQKSLGMCWWGKYGKETECIGIRECHKKELEVIKNLEHKLHIATEALKSILDEADVLDEFISKEGYLCGFVNIAQQALEQLGSEE